MLGFESSEHDVEPLMRTALQCCADHGGAGERRAAGRSPGDAVGSWREAFLRAPYLRDVFIAIGVLSETFETAITWDRFEALHESVNVATTPENSWPVTTCAPATCSTN